MARERPKTPSWIASSSDGRSHPPAYNSRRLPLATRASGLFFIHFLAMLTTSLMLHCIISCRASAPSRIMVRTSSLPPATPKLSPTSSLLSSARSRSNRRVENFDPSCRAIGISPSLLSEPLKSSASSFEPWSMMVKPPSSDSNKLLSSSSPFCCIKENELPIPS